MLKVKSWKKVFPANSNQKRAGMAIMLPDKLDFRSKKFTRDKVRHRILTKVSNHHEDLTFIKTYVNNES